MAEVIEIRGLALGYQRGDQTHRVLANFDLRVAHGEFVTIVGPSGVGKSTLLRAIASLSLPLAGEIRVNARQQPGRQSIAMVFQDARLLPWRRVLSNVSLGLEGLDLSRSQRLERAEQVLARVGLGDHYGERWPHELSGGQRQRVGLARALAVEPDLLLMDEPFAALDAITRQAMQDELLRVWSGTGISVIFVTHDLDEAVYLSDRVVLLSGTPAQITGDYAIDLPRPRRHDSHIRQWVARIQHGLSRAFDDYTI